MKNIIIATALVAVLAVSPALAQQAQHQHGAASAETGQPDQGAGMTMGSDAMQQHRQNMEEMRALMQQAHAATDPAERQRLMGEHHQMMQARMASMMRSHNSAMMQACQEQMAMMHDMMGQMAAHHEMIPSNQ